MRLRVLGRASAALAFLCVAWAAQAQQGAAIAPPCNMTAASYSGTVTGTSAVLIPAAASGITRTGIFIELLTPSASLGINPMGGTASLTAGGNIVVSTGATSPQNTSYINFAAMGFIPTGAITAIASGSVTVSAWACPG